MNHIMRTGAAAVLLFNSAFALATVPPQEIIQQTSDKVLSILKSQHEQIKNHSGQLVAIIKDVVLPHFDFLRMSRYVLGKYWRDATLAQQNEFTEQFQTLLIRTYGTAMKEYSGQEVRYLPFHAPVDADDVTVRTEIVQSGSAPIPVNYSLALSGGEWKVYDISIENTSLVSNYRSSFGSEIKSIGVGGLLSKIEARNQQSGAKISSE